MTSFFPLLATRVACSRFPPPFFNNGRGEKPIFIIPPVVLQAPNSSAGPVKSTLPPAKLYLLSLEFVRNSSSSAALAEMGNGPGLCPRPILKRTFQTCRTKAYRWTRPLGRCSLTPASPELQLAGGCATVTGRQDVPILPGRRF